MLKVFVSIISIIIIFIAIFLLNKQRKSTITKGIKSIITPICYVLIALTTLFAYLFKFAYLFNFVGWFTIAITAALLIIGIYFARYMIASAEDR